MPSRNEKLEGARLQRRWSVEVASAKVGVSVNTFNRWERGLQVPQLDTLDRLCNAFAMTPEELGFGHAIVSKRRSHEQPQSSITLPEDELQATSPFLFTNPSFSTPSPDDLLTHFSSRTVSRNQPFGDPDYQTGIQKADALVDVTRREAMTLLVSTPSMVFALAHDDKSLYLHPEEVLNLSTANLSLCWQLYFEGGLAEVARVLPGYLSQLTPLAQRPSPSQHKAAALASQAHQISYLLSIQRQDFGTALQHTRLASNFAQIANDQNLYVASLVRRAYVYYCLKYTTRRLLTYQEALHHSKGCSPLIRGYLYAGLAEAYAVHQDRQQAERYLDLAYKTFPEVPEKDPAFPFTRFRWPTIYTLDGQARLHLEQADHAWSAFEHVDQHVPQGLTPLRVEVMVHQAATAVSRGDQEQSCHILESATTSALSLGSQLRYDEAYAIYDQITARWGNDTRVRALADLFH